MDFISILDAIYATHYRSCFPLRNALLHHGLFQPHEHEHITEFKCFFSLFNQILSDKEQKHTRPKQVLHHTITNLTL